MVTSNAQCIDYLGTMAIVVVLGKYRGYFFWDLVVRKFFEKVKFHPTPFIVLKQEAY